MPGRQTHRQLRRLHGTTTTLQQGDSENIRLLSKRFHNDCCGTYRALKINRSIRYRPCCIVILVRLSGGIGSKSSGGCVCSGISASGSGSSGVDEPLRLLLLFLLHYYYYHY